MYAVDMLNVREIIRFQPITPIPNAADYIEGIINLRGKIIAIINLAKRLGLQEPKLQEKNRIIVAHNNEHLAGFIVDGDTEIINIKRDDILPPDKDIEKSPFLTGIGELEGFLVKILDIEKLVSAKIQEDLQLPQKNRESKEG